MFDVLIIGGGVSGFSAGLYSSRKGLNTVLVSPEVGGQANLTNTIENYPGIKHTTGSGLVLNIMDQAVGFGLNYVQDRVVNIKKLKKGFSVRCEKKTYSVKSIIICSGKSPKWVGFKGEKEFVGRGVSTCTTCDAPLFKKKIVAVVGSGLGACRAVSELSKICKKIYLIPTGVIPRLEDLKGIKYELLEDYKILEVKGQVMVSNLLLEKEGKIKDLVVNGVFVKGGYITDSSPFKELVKTTKRGEIRIDRDAKTSVSGVFAAGDITDLGFEQAIISAGEGAKAALSAYSFVTGHDKKKDWDH